MLKFADDTKLVARVGSEEDRDRPRQDLFELFKWSEDWQMLFNLDKCAVMHFGFANEGMEAGPPRGNPGPWAERSRALSYRAVTGPILPM